MDTVNISNYIEAWLAKNEGRVNDMSMQIQKITDDFLEICIDGRILQIGIPHNFYISCSSDGIISNSNCAFVVTLTNARLDESQSMDTCPELLTDLNEKLDRMSSRGFYSFSGVLDSVLDAFEKYKSSTGSDGAAAISSDDQAYRMALKRCVVCDKELPFKVSKLCSCDNELCLFSFEELGLGAQVLQELIRMPVELIDLEISLALNAANGYRDVFEPFPPFLLKKREIRQRSDVLNNINFANPKDNPNSNTQNKKNIVYLGSTIKSFPSNTQNNKSNTNNSNFANPKANPNSNTQNKKNIFALGSTVKSFPSNTQNNKSNTNNSNFANPKANPNSNTQNKKNIVASGSTIKSFPSNTQNNKNIDALRSIIKSFPSVSEMRLCANEVELKEKLAKSWLSTTEGKLAQDLGDEYVRNEDWQLPYNVLRFILCTHRLSLVFLSDELDYYLKLDNSKSQFYLFAVVQDSPEREVVHSSKNKQEASIFGFHGSKNQNWYSILRNGLRCLSNTNLMSTGNSFGDGIYLANNFQISANYANGCMGSDDCWNNGMYNDGFRVVSICEVISSASIKEGPGGTFLVPKEQEGNVAVRYLLVFGKQYKIPSATICDGHILSHDGYSVDLSEHYQSIRNTAFSEH